MTTSPAPHAPTAVNVTVGNSGRKVHRAYLAHNGQASTTCGAERRGVGVTHTRRTDKPVDCLACSPSSAPAPAAPAAVIVPDAGTVAMRAALVAAREAREAAVEPAAEAAPAVNVRVGRAGRTVHATMTNAAGDRLKLTACGAEGRNIASRATSRLYDTTDAVTCHTCLKTAEVTARRVAEVEAIADAAEPTAEAVEAPAVEAPVVTTRTVGRDLYEVAVDGTAAGRVAMVAGARWLGYDLTGERRTGSPLDSLADAVAAVVALGCTPDAPRGAEPAAVVTVEALVADTLRLGYATVAAYVAAPGRELGQVTPWTLNRAEGALAYEVDRRQRAADPVLDAQRVEDRARELLDAERVTVPDGRRGTVRPGSAYLARERGEVVVVDLDGGPAVEVSRMLLR